MPGIGVNDILFGDSQVIICSKIDMGRTGGIHQSDGHQNRGIDPGSQVLDINITQVLIDVIF